MNSEVARPVVDKQMSPLRKKSKISDMINQKKVSPEIVYNSSTVMEKEIGKRIESSLIIGDTMTVQDDSIDNPLRISHNT